MKMLTLRMKPKTIFGIILIITGVVVIMITFISNHVDVRSTNVMSAVTLKQMNSERNI